MQKSPDNDSFSDTIFVIEMDKFVLKKPNGTNNTVNSTSEGLTINFPAGQKQQSCTKKGLDFVSAHQLTV